MSDGGLFTGWNYFMKSLFFELTFLKKPYFETSYLLILIQVLQCPVREVTCWAISSQIYWNATSSQRLWRCQYIPKFSLEDRALQFWTQGVLVKGWGRGRRIPGGGREVNLVGEKCPPQQAFLRPLYHSCGRYSSTFIKVFSSLYHTWLHERRKDLPQVSHFSQIC